MNRVFFLAILMVALLGVFGLTGCSDDDGGDCGNGVCGTGENPTNCPDDCEANQCGNNATEGTEECDGESLPNKQCSDYGNYTGGTISCDSSCKISTANCTTNENCGNGTIDDNEDCDGTNLNEQKCEDIGNYTGGSLSCNNDCSFNTSQCTVPENCGNGNIDDNEDCDGTNLNEQKCEDIGNYTSGELSCNDDCSFNTDECMADEDCGNGEIDGNEQCDGTNLNGKECSNVGNYTGGTLSCENDCTFNTTECTVPENCGNGEIDANEDCDGTNLNEQDCTDLGYTGGELSCNDDCSFNDTECTTELDCGNGEIDEGEDCDGNNLNNQSCDTIGYTDGTLACNDDCRFDTTQCTVPANCGNGLIDVADGEECDTDNLGGQTCEMVDDSFTGGLLRCGGGCMFDTRLCTNFQCGNNVRDPGEECDGDLRGATCESLGFVSGDLICTDCSYDTTNCVSAVCPNGTRELYEECDGADLNNQSCTDLGFTGGDLACTENCSFDTTNCTITELLADGEPCKFDSQCAGGLCLTENGSGMPSGYCTEYCEETCTNTDSTCVQITSYTAVCLKNCDTAGNDCRDGYMCYDVSGQGVCVGNCTDNNECSETGYCDLTGDAPHFCDCPAGEHYSSQYGRCVTDSCSSLGCEDLNMACDPIGGCNGSCSVCDGCLNPGFIQSTNHCFPPDATWGSKCDKNSDCPGTGIPGENIFCDSVTGGYCIEQDGPDYVDEGQPCSLTPTRTDPDSVGFSYTDPYYGNTSTYCVKNCEDNTDCRPGYACSIGINDTEDANACLGIFDCADSGCNDENSQIPYYCDEGAEDQMCWVDNCALDICSTIPNTTADSCQNSGQDFTCGCAEGYRWDNQTNTCIAWTCGAIDIGTFNGTDPINAGEGLSTCDGTSIYSPEGEEPCTGYAQPGNEMIFSVVLTAGTSGTITVDSTEDLSIYLINSCSDFTASSCINSIDTGDNPERLIISNTTQSDQTYYIVVDAYVTTTCGAFTLTVTPPECGNGFVEGEEQCDDGNDVTTDGCDNCTLACGAIVINYNGTDTVTLEEQDSCTNGTNYYNPDGDACTGYDAEGSEIVYQLDIPAHDNVRITEAPTNGFDASLYVIDSCMNYNPTDCIAGSDEGNPEVVEIENTTDATVTYYIVADAYDSITGSCGTFTLTVEKIQN